MSQTFWSKSCQKCWSKMLTTIFSKNWSQISVKNCYKIFVQKYVQSVGLKLDQHFALKINLHYYYYYYLTCKHLCQKNSIAEPQLQITTWFFGLCPYTPNLLWNSLLVIMGQRVFFQAKIQVQAEKFSPQLKKLKKKLCFGNPAKVSNNLGCIHFGLCVWVILCVYIWLVCFFHLRDNLISLIWTNLAIWCQTIACIHASLCAWDTLHAHID